MAIVAGYCSAMQQREVWMLAGIVGVAAAARFATLDLQSFHHDEAVTANRVIASSLFDTLDHVAEGERSPPLYYVLAWAWAKLFGTAEVGLRSLSALIGTLTVPAAYLAGRELASRRIGLFASVFVALNPYLIWYSQEARSYALMVLLTTLGLAFFARALRDRSPSSLALWAAASALAVCSHYFAAFLVAPQALWLLWAARPERGRALLGVAAVAAVGLALVPLALGQEGDDRRNAFADVSLATRAGEVALDYVASEEPGPLAADSRIDALQIGAAAAGGALFLVALWLIVRRGLPDEQRAATIAAAVAGSAIAVPFALAIIGLDFANPRNMIGGLVPILVVGAIGFGGGRAGRVGTIGAVAICLLFLAVHGAVIASAQMQRPDWREAAEAIGESDEVRVIVTNANGDEPLKYYLGARILDNRRYRSGVRTREIDTLSTSFRTRRPAGFRLSDEQGLAPLFILRRYTAPRRLRVRHEDVAGRRVLYERSVVLVDPPR
ncbi:MAG TPA: glycosyltransferase family 39 protein [Solirubrobacterales bacterium]|nr:glycosyltransferase family 39 protein [Solirubrobacterales bacterium]